MGVRKIDVQWHNMPMPTSTQQRIGFLNACQKSFSEVLSTPPSVAGMRIMPSDGAPYQVCELSRARAYPLRVHENARFRCACCHSQTAVFPDASILANPFSDLLALVCERCSAPV